MGNGKLREKRQYTDVWPRAIKEESVAHRIEEPKEGGFS